MLLLLGALQMRVLVTPLITLATLLLINTLTADTLAQQILNQKTASQETIKTKVQELRKDNQTIINILAQELDEQRHQLLLALQKTFASQEAWDAVLSELAMVRTQDTLLSQVQISAPCDDERHPLSVKAQKLMILAGINPAMVTVTLATNLKRITRAAVGQGYDGQQVTHDLEINTAQMEKHPDKEQDAIFKQVLIRLLKYDALEQAAIESMFERNGITPDHYRKHPAYRAYCMHQQYRADLLASNTIEAAHATLQMLERLAKEYPEFCIKDSLYTPSITKRYSAVENLLSYLEAEQQAYT